MKDKHFIVPTYWVCNAVWRITHLVWSLKVRFTKPRTKLSKILTLPSHNIMSRLFPVISRFSDHCYINLGFTKEKPLQCSVHWRIWINGCRMISHGQRVFKMHSSHISDLTRLFLWSKLFAKNTNFKEWEFSVDVRELFSKWYMVSNMREIKSDLNPLFTPWCPVWVVFRVFPTPPFLFMSAMPD